MFANRAEFSAEPNQKRPRKKRPVDGCDARLPSRRHSREVEHLHPGELRAYRARVEARLLAPDRAQVRPGARIARVEQLLQPFEIRVRLVHHRTFSLVLATINIAPATFLAIVATAAAAGTAAALATGRGVIVPVVVVELVFGIVLGPQVLGLHVDQFISFFSALGLGLLFFFAGYEIDVRRIRGQPLRLALLGWGMSLALAYAIGGVLAAAGVVLSLLYTGSALATTAIGTLIPILSDTGELRTRFGTYLLAAGAVGEFGPIMLLTLILSTQSTLHNALILVVFVGLAVGVAVLAVRSSERTLPLLVRTLEGSSQLLVRWIVVLVFALALLALELGLDLLLGGFAAGIITREVLRTREIPAFDSKLTAIAFGVFVPFFFVVSGMRLDVASLVASVSGVVKMVAFFVLFLVVRGTPALLLYRRVLEARERTALALLTSTQLPLVIAITTLATETGHMRRSTAAALVGAAVLSTLVFPILGLRLRGDIVDQAVLAESPATPT
jgi:Kef-type K+ transport system membrane component KefB